MGMQIIKQPDGKFGLFSNVSDTITTLDCTEEELIQLWKERAAARAEEEMKEWLEEAKGERPQIHAKPITLKRALKDHLFHGGPNADWDETIKERKKKEGVK